ncbi:unnamed protein product [Porites evermanni]|uniref:von Willebrand factor A domain-containing protein 7 n=1 Tax=Porites evermanni TaxID=104178 RepID=A0ABN8N402_9CNID|nr:unnamed protein product [Porites evermanni]
MKTLFLLSSLIFLAYPLVRVKAFLPRINVGGGGSTSFDHALITKGGFLRPLIYFFRDNPQYLKDQHLTSFLLDMLSSDSTDALEETVDNITPQIKFLNALSTILSANAEVDSFPLSRSASAHFDGEQFRQGNARLIQLRQELITSLLQGDKLQHARNLAGTALHTLQDFYNFYSHSNWIELGNPGPYGVLGKPGSVIPLEYIAGPTEATCENCEPGTCESNLITLKLTSGYRSGQDVKKPENIRKCSHGGTLDESRLKPATGGINKDTTTTVESPHASLHNIAADLAAEATSIFLSDTRSTVGDDIFAKFLNLKSENSMALVIDISGSMSDEISEVKSLSINFVQKTLEKKGSSFTYILVPFSDPGVGPVTVTSDAKTVIEAVNNLTITGGGDCPELGMTGLYQALLHCLPETNIYYFSDADVKDEYRENEVISLAKKKKVKIDFILSGQCSRRKKRSVQQSESFKEFRRIRRSVQGQALYQSVASQTGGQVFHASKAEVADLVEIIDPGSPVNSSVDLQEIGLLNIEESRAQYFSGQSYFVAIDSTLQSLVLVLTAAGSPSLYIQTVEGNATLQEKIITSSRRLLILEVSNLVSGLLNMTVSCVGPYTLQVNGFSPLDFTYQLLDVEDLERGITRRVVGNPLRGQTLWLTLDFVGRKEIDRVSFLTLVDLNGTDLETFNITQGQGFYKNTYFVTFVPSAEKFRLKVTGIDKTGAHFQRVKPTLFTLGDIKLSQNVDNINGSNSIFPGETLDLEINVENSGDTQTLYFTASDDLKYFRSISPSQDTLGKDDTLALRLALIAPSNARYGVTSTVTVFASQNSDHTQVVNFMVFFVTVASKYPDVSSPSCSITNQTETCASVYGRPECVSSTWFAHVMFIDAGEGMFSITTRDNTNGTLNVETFNQGAVNKSISASFTSDCCNPRVIFVGLDLVGNMGTCSISLVPDIVSLSAKPSNTAVSIYPGNTTKVPFTVLNLGSAGSFSFQVTKAPKLFSYVIPFSLALESNVSAAGYVMIKSLGEVN